MISKCFLAHLVTAALSGMILLVPGSATAADRDFAKGADISLLQQLDDAGAVYRNHGKRADALDIFKENGFNYMRLRLFHTPKGDGSVCNDLPYTLKLAKRIKAAGFALLLDFHYSDTWADPGHQIVPVAWKSLSHEDLVKAVREYTRDVIRTFRENGALPDMVQIGNEITNGMMWEDGRLSKKPVPDGGWNRLGDLVKAGVSGAREGAAGKPMRIMIHIDRGGDKATSKWFYDNLLAQGVDFDVIGLSYYPFWHGSFNDLRENLTSLATAYRKDIMVAETGFPWQPQRFADGKTLLSLEDSAKRFLPYPPTPDGQKAFLKALIEIIRNAPQHRGTGLFYWQAEWIKAPKNWNAPGWAGDWEHRALFDQNGNALPGLAAFREE